MKRSRILAALLGLVTILVLAPASQAAPPPLSELCGSLHGGADRLISAQAGTVTLTGPLAAGEQVLIRNQQFAAQVTATGPGGSSATSVPPDGVYRYDVTVDGPHQIVIKGTPVGTPVSVQLDCGIPPRATITSPTADDEIYVYGIGIPQFSCEAGTNEVASCVSDPESVDTSSAGEKQLTVTATDTEGLVSTARVSYTVRKYGQRIELPEELPETVQWFRGPWFFTPTATSGLPVHVSSDPASTACFVDGDAAPLVVFATDRPGVCILHLDQAGNEQYLPAERVTRTIVVTRQDSFLTTGKTGKGLLGLSPTTFRAELEVVSWFGPSQVVWGYPGQPVSFWVKGKKVCTGTTELVPSDNPFDRTTVAVCKAPIGVNAALTATEYTARYDGDESYLPSSATGRLTP